MDINLNTMLGATNILTGENSVVSNDPEAFSAELQAFSAPDLDGKADYTAGQFGLDVNQDGVPIRMNYFDPSGIKLTSSAFSADAILRLSEKFDLDLEPLNDLAAKLDEAGVAYKPYQLYSGTGSDHGIDLNDLANGGLGTAYDWRQDPNVSLKGPNADVRLAENQELADRLNLVLNPSVTSNTGINPTLFSAMNTDAGSFSHVSWNSNVAVWSGSEEEALEMAHRLYGQMKSL